ncbi:zinc dependent phospholipase C family protein [Mucilaginibacter glaciei]|uniref:Zinc dependent phospholipase C family protein n=1 Tax=Mucilaginibacter glaciei TaxID=2772109 RepID=A0A926NLN2_9SPHI|nr:zinc dependent phospholipase C family protein [Mucilaginibacter glaciei]MBD1394379.1 zinc dependent phospholipase C family protein [Mucilaginibacter glaciei]
MQTSVNYIFRSIVLTTLFLFAGLTSNAYSILAHEAIIDASWKQVTIPLLKQKYPDATREDLLLAHSFAYGGSIVADMGYMPFGNAIFTDLVHYVRSGDFVEALIKDASNLNEYAFALGAMSHYMADKYGHSMSTNLNVPIIYPELKKKFGNVVTYNDDHSSHSRMEFTYDVLQIGQGNYTSEGYHDFIGFNISVPVLERAFYETYGLQLGSIFSNINGDINTMRWGVRNLFPLLTKSAYKSNQSEIEKLHPGMTAKKFKYRLSKRSYNLEFGKEHKQSKFFARAAVFLISILPKVGPLKNLKFVSPGNEGLKLFAQGFIAISQNYQAALADVGQPGFQLPDIDFDTGKPTHLGEYPLADNTYSKLLEKLNKQNYKNITPDLKNNIVNYFNHADTAKLILTDHPERWAKTSVFLKQIKNITPMPQDTLISLVKDNPTKIDPPKL